MRFLSPEDHEALVKSVIEERKIRRRIQELQVRCCSVYGCLFATCLVVVSLSVLKCPKIFLTVAYYEEEIPMFMFSPDLTTIIH